MTSASNTTSRKTGNHLLALYAALNHALLRAWCAAPSRWCRATVRLGAEYTVDTAGNLPDSEVFSRPEFGNVALRRVHGFGRDALVRKAGGMAVSMYSTSRHPLRRLNNGASGSESHTGAETMTTSQLASRSAAPTTPTTGNTTRIDSTSEEAQAFALLQASSDATMAKLYLSRGNVPAARRKAVQLLKALQLLEVAA